MPQRSRSQLQANLRQLLEKNNISQSELARRCSVQQKVINRLLVDGDDSHSPTLSTLESVASGLGLTVPDLLSPGFAALTPDVVALSDVTSIETKIGLLVRAFLSCSPRDQGAVLSLARTLAESKAHKD